MKHKVSIYLLVIVSTIVALLFLDIRIAAWVHDHHFSELTRDLFSFVRLPGRYSFTLAIAPLVVWRIRRRWRAAAILLIAGAAASAVTGILKLCAGRIRPFRGRAAFDWVPFSVSPFDTLHTRDLSFPSGDTTLAFATAVVVAALLPRWGRIAWLWAILVAVTRVLQGVHYPSDVAAGAAVGVLTANIVQRMLKWPNDTSTSEL